MRLRALTVPKPRYAFFGTVKNPTSKSYVENPHPADEIQKDSCATFLICLPPSMRGVPALGKNSPHSGEGDTPPPLTKGAQNV